MINPTNKTVITTTESPPPTICILQYLCTSPTFLDRLSLIDDSIVK
ncbi:hypothetical protein MICAC_5930003 [Microcystis aeruginosa PCC 9443]|uniref:Uncharacterized protein n=1 Tax=Microcystis aeruginosa PCC 9443 TaxID=1160281 RepID=I4G9V6_MICAE|nr:hypothetical protein MICAC_5930003 [Microcystis aeruginosa PCC 9443]